MNLWELSAKNLRGKLCPRFAVVCMMRVKVSPALPPMER